MPKKALASLDIYKLLEELDLGETAFVRNVKSRKNEFYLQLFGKKEAWIRFVPGSYMCAVSEKPAVFGRLLTNDIPKSGNQRLDEAYSTLDYTRGDAFLINFSLSLPVGRRYTGGCLW